MLAAADGAKTAALVWDWQHPEQPTSNGVFFAKPVPAVRAPDVKLALRHLPAGRYRLQVRRTGHQANDAYTAYLEMGAPKDLSAQQLGKLQKLDAGPARDRSCREGRQGRHAAVDAADAQQRHRARHAAAGPRRGTRPLSERGRSRPAYRGSLARSTFWPKL